jgi:magnesium transporter
VLQQDPREKFDTFDRLGYYFVVVRALDEGYFKYTPGSTTLVGAGEKVVINTPTSSPTLSANSDKTKEGRRRGWGMGRASGKMASKVGEKVEIVEDNPGKEGLEGVGVGALNIYLVVFADGIVSVSRQPSLHLTPVPL